MLSNLASYLLGYGDANNSENAATGGAAGGARAPSEGDDNVRLTTVETDEDDWLMVEASRDGERRSSTASLPNINLEESWFVTPPPCFTSTGPVQVETSPLENLLIEHPSMSVYHRRPAGLRPASPQRPQRARSLSPRRPVQARVRAPLQPRQLHNLQVQAVHQAQKHQLMKESQVNRTKQMERQNKAVNVNKRNKRQRRADRQKNHSGANNNRKCC